MAAVHMTEGSITRHLVHYSVPLILGNLFQLTYNVVDSIIAGRFIGKEALAAEGTANPVMNIVILGISGICMGASVLMSEFFGAGEYRKLKREMSTTVLFGLFFSIGVALLGVMFARPLLTVLQVPEELLDMASVYLAITFLGAPFTYFYNAVSAALKSVGDSQTPLRFLAFSAILNAVLDLIFIGGLDFGIVCSATTTVIAEAASALLCIVYVYRKIPMLRLGKGEFHMDTGLLKRTLQYGSVTALQQSCQPIGKLLIQGAINPLGVDMIAAYNAVNRVDDYAFTPEQSISQRHHHLCGPEPGRGKEGANQPGFCHRPGAGIYLLGADLYPDSPAQTAHYGTVCDGRGRRSGGAWRILPGNDGVFLHFPGLHQRISGIFPGNGADEDDPAGNLYPDLPAGDFRLSPGPFHGNERGGCGLRHRMERDAFGGGALRAGDFKKGQIEAGV